MPTAVYPGSFDPVTLGHMDLIKRAVSVFGALTVAVAKNSEKKGLFSTAERVALLTAALADCPEVQVDSFEGLVVEYCKRKGIDVILRGLRTVSDFESEYQMALTNRHLAPDVETVFMMPSVRYGFVSSSLIRDVLANGGDVSDWISPGVVTALRRKMRGKA